MPEIKIFDVLPKEEILAQLAEECAEASKAALKLRRACSGVNPTPVSENEALLNPSGNLIHTASAVSIFGANNAIPSTVLRPTTAVAVELR